MLSNIYTIYPRILRYRNYRGQGFYSVKLDSDGRPRISIGTELVGENEFNWAQQKSYVNQVSFFCLLRKNSVLYPLILNNYRLIPKNVWIPVQINFGDEKIVFFQLRLQQCIETAIGAKIISSLTDMRKNQLFLFL